MTKKFSPRWVVPVGYVHDFWRLSRRYNTRQNRRRLAEKFWNIWHAENGFRTDRNSDK